MSQKIILTIAIPPKNFFRLYHIAETKKILDALSGIFLSRKIFICGVEAAEEEDYVRARDGGRRDNRGDVRDDNRGGGRRGSRDGCAYRVREANL